MRRTPRDGSGTGHGWITQAELLKVTKSGQFPDDLVKIKASYRSMGTTGDPVPVGHRDGPDHHFTG